MKTFFLDITPLKVRDENRNEFFRLWLTTDTEVMTAQFIASNTEQIIDIEDKFKSQKVKIWLNKYSTSFLGIILNKIVKIN